MILASGSDGLQLHREEGWEELPTAEALRELDLPRRWISSQVRLFVAHSRVLHPDLRELGDHEVANFVRRCVRRREMVVLRPGGARAEDTDRTLELRRLIVQIETQVRGRLSYRGRQYKLALGDELGQVPDRNLYEVLSQADARRVLEGIAGEPGVPAGLLAKANEELSKDWQAPWSQPDGLVLLRRTPIQASASKSDGPAITPSQMRALFEDVVEIELVDADDAPVANEAWELLLPDGRVLSGQLDESGYARIGPVPTSGCQIRFPNLDADAWAACN